MKPSHFLYESQKSYIKSKKLVSRIIFDEYMLAKDRL